MIIKNLDGRIRCSDKSENIIYRSKMHKGKNRNFEILNPIKFIHRICLHIPDRYESLIRYYGYYSNASRKRRKRKIESQKELKISDDTIDIRSARKTWAMLIHRVYGVGPLLCPKCGSEMKIIAFIQARSEIIKILKHLDLYPTEKPEPIKERASRLFLPEASHKYSINTIYFQKQPSKEMVSSILGKNPKFAFC